MAIKTVTLTSAPERATQNHTMLIDRWREEDALYVTKRIKVERVDSTLRNWRLAPSLVTIRICDRIALVTQLETLVEGIDIRILIHTKDDIAFEFFSETKTTIDLSIEFELKQ